MKHQKLLRLFCSCFSFTFLILFHFISSSFIIRKWKGYTLTRGGIGGMLWRVTEKAFSTTQWITVDFSRRTKLCTHKLIACYKNFNLKFNFRRTVYWALSFVFVHSFSPFFPSPFGIQLWRMCVCMYGWYLIDISKFIWDCEWK